MWELSVMAATPRATAIGVTAGLCCIGVVLLPPGWGLPLVMLPALLGIGSTTRASLAHAVFAVLLVLAGYGMIDLRGHYAAGWLIWLVLVVIATDVAGYFVGRLAGRAEVLAQGQSQEDLVGDRGRLDRGRPGGRGGGPARPCRS